jgi:hypothetical protein
MTRQLRHAASGASAPQNLRTCAQQPRYVRPSAVTMISVVCATFWTLRTDSHMPFWVNQVVPQYRVILYRAPENGNGYETRFPQDVPDTCKAQGHDTRDTLY